MTKAQRNNATFREDTNFTGVTVLCKSLEPPRAAGFEWRKTLLWWKSNQNRSVDDIIIDIFFSIVLWSLTPLPFMPSTLFEWSHYCGTDTETQANKWLKIQHTVWRNIVVVISSTCSIIQLHAALRQVMQPSMGCLSHSDVMIPMSTKTCSFTTLRHCNYSSKNEFG